MGAWKNLGKVQYGVAIAKFEGNGPQFLSLSLGVAVLIEEVTDNLEWYRGCFFLNQTYYGIFPASYIHVKNCAIACERIGEIDNTVSKELSVLDEVTTVLSEWREIHKQLFVKNSGKTEKLRKHFQDLLSWRRQVMTGALTSDQLKQVKLDIANVIDYGNKFLGLDLVIRDNEGNVLDVNTTGVIEIFKRNQESAQRTETPLEQQSSDRSGGNQYNQYSLFVCLKNVVCKLEEDSEVLISLYDERINKFISEYYFVAWDKQGMPKDLAKLHNLTCLFTDLGPKDLERDKLFIVCQIIRYGKMDMKDTSHKRQTQNLRRPFAVAVLHINDIINDKRIENEDKEFFLQLNLVNNDDIDSTIRKSIQKTASEAKGQGIWLTMQLLHGDFNMIKESHPLLVNQYTAITRKQGFPDVIMPGDVRNDMYISVISGTFEKGSKKSSKNIQVTLSVYDSDGQLLKEMFRPGSGEAAVTEYASTVYYHNLSPKWSEVCKLEIPIDLVRKGSHIRFSFKHRATYEEKDKSQKVFAISYVQLIGENGTCLQDSIHDLAVYKVLKRIDNCGVYLSLPSKKEVATQLNLTKKHIGGNALSFSKNENLRIRFQLCSTKLAQNVDLLALLRWRTQKDKLKTILPAMMNVSGEEIVKFLQDTLDALFAILMEDSQEYGEMVVDVVVYCIMLLADKKYQNFRAILDAYIENLFSSTKVYITLLDILQKNIEEAHNPDIAANKRDNTIKYFKALEYLVKFIVRSRSLSERAAPGKARLEFEASIINLISAVITMMKMSENNVITLQGCALKYIPSMFGDLLKVYDATQLGLFARDMIERICPGKLQMQKLACVHNLVRSQLFSHPASRQVVLPMVIGQLKYNMTRFEELKVCADIMNEMLGSFYMIKEVGNTDHDIEYIVTELFSCIVNSVIIRMNPQSQPFMGNYVAFVICILDLMKEEHYELYLNSYDSDLQLLDGLMALFLVIREFIQNNVFPPDWSSMIMIQNSVILRALNYFSEALYDKFLVKESFQMQLWKNFFQLAVAFITQDALQLETFSETKRNKILTNYDDMRMSIGLKVVDMWQWLGINKIRLIQNMIQPFLEMTLIPETELRRATIPIFFDMIECEFKNRQHFKQIESELIKHLDHLVETDLKGDEEYKDLFNQILEEKFQEQKEKNPPLAKAGLIFVQIITKLMSRLLDYRSVILSEDNINNRMSCTVNILNFYQENHREEMKERYLYKLCDLHISVGSYTEAAFTLLQHAELLKWSDEPLPNMMSSERYQAKTQRELKERLYRDIIDYFDKAKMWEYGISRCKELAQQYEQETYDYAQLSEMLKKQAIFFENIINPRSIRPQPTYFRVGFYGRGFPTFLRNKVFIYRGDELEQLNDFSMRLSVQFPGGKFLKTLEAPGPDITESFAQHIQACKVDAKPVERRKFRGKPIADQIKKFYEVNDVSEFVLSRPFHKGERDKEVEFKTLWIEKTMMNTEYSFPGKLRWFEVTTSNTAQLCPLENAIDTLRTKNKELAALINQYTPDTKVDLNPLSMMLKGVIDANVMGGIPVYEKLFFTKDYILENPEHNEMINMLKEVIVEQVDICEKGLDVHRRLVTIEMEPFHKDMENKFKDSKQRAAPYRKLSKVRPPSSTMSRQVRPDSVIMHRGNAVTTRRARSTFDLLSDTSNDSTNQSLISPSRDKRLTTPANENRHTTIVGPSSPIHAMMQSRSHEAIPNPPPVDRDTKATTPPPLAPKLSKTMSLTVGQSPPALTRTMTTVTPPTNGPPVLHARVPLPNQVSIEENQEEDEEDLPPIPMKKTNRITNRAEQNVSPEKPAVFPKSSPLPSPVAPLKPMRVPRPAVPAASIEESEELPPVPVKKHRSVSSAHEEEDEDQAPPPIPPK